MEGPWLGGITPIRSGVAGEAVGHANDLWLAVAGQVRKGGRLVVHDIENFVARPVCIIAGSFLSRVLVPRRVLSRKAEDQNVVPAVLVEVIAEGEKVVGISVVLAERTLETFDSYFGAVWQLLLERG